jgi:hypothetical protein
MAEDKKPEVDPFSQVPGRERRESLRSNVEAGIRLPGRKHPILMKGNLSLDGVYFKTTSPIEIDTEVELYLPLSGYGYGIFVNGVVSKLNSRKDEEGFFVKFHEPDFEAQRLLARFLDTTNPHIKTEELFVGSSGVQSDD